VSEGWQESENFSKNGCFLVSSGKKQISPLLAPPRKTFGKIHWFPPGKHPFDTHALKNYTIFGKNVVFHHLATLLNNANAVSQP